MKASHRCGAPSQPVLRCLMISLSVAHLHTPEVLMLLSIVMQSVYLPRVPIKPPPHALMI